MTSNCASEEPACINSSDIWERAPSGLYCVRGDLIVQDRTAEDLEVLTRAIGVEGSLLIHDNRRLEELPELPALVYVDGGISISANAALVEIHGFPALETLGGGLYIAENPNLERFTFSERLTSMESVFFGLNDRLSDLRMGVERVTRDVAFSGNAALELLEMPALVEVGGNLHINENAQLHAANFPVLRSIAGVWQISGNESLVEFTLPSLFEHCAWILVNENDVLLDVTLASGAGISTITIDNNPSLQQITGADDIRLEPDALIFVRANPSLTVIQGFDDVLQLRKFIVTGNESLREIPGFSSLTSADEGFWVVENPVLEAPADWFSALSHASDVRIYGNDALSPTQVDALLAHVSVVGTPRVGDNMGQETALSPCPWPNDRVCDAASETEESTQLCVEDPEDCDG